MKQIIAAGVLVLMAAFHVQGAESITGEYRTRQKNLTGTLLVKQLPDNRLKFDIQTVKKGGGDYAGSVTTCSASGIAERKGGGTAVYSNKEDYMEIPFKVVMRLKNNRIVVESNADEVSMCGMGAWLDGEYVKKNSKEPKFSE